MALLRAIALTLLLTVLTATLRPEAAQAAAEPPSLSRGAAATPLPEAGRGSARAGRIPQAPTLPGKGSSSNPYDMEALRGFDAGSHR